MSEPTVVINSALSASQAEYLYATHVVQEAFRDNWRALALGDREMMRVAARAMEPMLRFQQWTLDVMLGRPTSKLLPEADEKAMTPYITHPRCRGFERGN